jgi:hypothetical protein
MSVLLGEVAPQNTGVAFGDFSKVVATAPPQEGLNKNWSEAKSSYDVSSSPVDATPKTPIIDESEKGLPPPPTTMDTIKKYAPYVILGAALLYFVMRKK